MKRILLLTGVYLTVMTNVANARTWRVNNDATKSPDFTTVIDAITAASPGDTLLIEASPTAYAGFTLNKRLVLLGSGYFLSGNDLQATKDSSTAVSLNVDSSSVTANGSGSVIAGLTVNGGIVLLHNVHDVIITRCHILSQIDFSSYNRPAGGLVISQCFLESNIVNVGITAQINLRVESNIFSTANGTGFFGLNLDNNLTGTFRNNTLNIAGTAITLNNFYISNNVFSNPATTTINGSNNIIRNNTFAAPTVAGVTDGVDENHTNVSMTGLFAGNIATGYGDTRFQTAGPGPLRGTGETIGGITPDRGAYSTVAATDGYRSSGIPPIPTIYRLTVPVSVSTSATTVDIIVSTRSNN